jgi:hypothetical protein
VEEDEVMFLYRLYKWNRWKKLKEQTE